MTDVEAHGCEDFSCTRRRLLTGGAAVAGIAALQLAAPKLAFAQGRARGDLLVVVSLRGGADGLSFVPPIADHGYSANRHEIVVRPGQAIRLDRTFGLHPGLKPLLPYWRDKRLAIQRCLRRFVGVRVSVQRNHEDAFEHVATIYTKSGVPPSNERGSAEGFRGPRASPAEAAPRRGYEASPHRRRRAPRT